MGGIGMSKGDFKAIENSRIMDPVQYKHIYCNDFFKVSESIMIITDLETGKIIDANEVACYFYQYDYEHITKLKLSDINLCSIEEIDMEMKHTAGQQKNCFYFKHKLANGEIRDVEVHRSITHNSKKLLYSIIYDITDRKK
jgi:PAS domain S-box-containing protein